MVMMGGLAGFILRGRSTAALVITAFGVLTPVFPPLSVLSGGALSLVALRNTVLETWLVLSIAVAVSGLFFWVASGTPMAALTLLGLWLPLIACATILRRTGNLSLAMMSAGLCAAAFLFAVYSMLENPAELWQQILQQVLKNADLGMDAQQLDEQVVLISHYMTGFVAASFMANMIVSILIGRAWQARLYNPGGFRREYLALHLGQALTVVFAAVLIAAIASQSEILKQLLFLFLLLYLFQGIAVAHAWVDGKKGGTAWLVVFYAALIIVWQMLLIVALFGMIDAWLDVRRRWIKPD